MAVHSPASLSNGGLVRSSVTRANSPRRWARTIIRARMRSPRRNCARCSAVCAADVPLVDVGSHGDGFFLTDLLIPLLRVGLGGMQSHLSAVDAGLLAPLDQSVGLRERAVSLGGGYAKVVPWKSLHRCNGAVSSLMRQPMTLRVDGLDVRGWYRETNPCTRCTSGRISNLARGETSPYGTTNGEHFPSGAGCDGLVHEP